MVSVSEQLFRTCLLILGSIQLRGFSADNELKRNYIYLNNLRFRSLRGVNSAPLYLIVVVISLVQGTYRFYQPETGGGYVNRGLSVVQYLPSFEIARKMVIAD